MPRRLPWHRSLLGLVALVTLVALMGTTQAHHSADHALMRIVLRPDASVVTFTFNGTLTVLEDAQGSYLTIPVPVGSDPGRFAPPDEEGSTLWSVEGDAPIATFHYSGTSAPAAGTAIEDVLLEATMTVGPGQNAEIAWARPDTPSTFLEVLLPDGYALSQSAGLVIQIHERPEAGMRRWLQSEFTGPQLGLTLRSIPSGPDAAHATPPAAGLGWLVILGLGALSGGVWYLGHRTDRQEDQP